MPPMGTAIRSGDNGHTDARRQRTRHALLGAFFVLVLERRYHEVRIDDIVARAGVGRSTFYEHFANKDALLAASLEGPFSILADAVVAPSAPHLPGLLAHFWQNRALARGILSGAVRRKVARVLVALIEQRLRRHHGAHLRVPPRLVAVALAEAQLGPITAWLDGEAACPPEALAQALHDGARALVDACSVSRGDGRR